MSRQIANCVDVGYLGLSGQPAQLHILYELLSEGSHDYTS
jgi:hypothetical protein